MLRPLFIIILTLNLEKRLEELAQACFTKLVRLGMAAQAARILQFMGRLPIILMVLSNNQRAHTSAKQRICPGHQNSMLKILPMPKVSLDPPDHGILAIVY